MNTLSHGVLTDTHLLTLQEGKLHTFPCKVNSWEEMNRLGIARGLRNIWLVPGSQMSLDTIGWNTDLPEYEAHFTQLTQVINRETKESKDFTVASYINRLSGSFDEKRIVSIHIPQLDTRWDADNGFKLGYVDDPLTLLGALKYLTDALGVDIGGPGYTGRERLMRKTCPAYTERPDLSMCPDHIEIDVHWKRPLTASEQSRKYMHFFDRNSQRLASATGAQIGIGSPDYYGPGVIHRPNLKLAGSWLVTCLPNAEYDLFPFVVPNARTWAHSETIQAMLDMGYQVTFHEGYQWTKQTRLLETWARLIWNTRQDLKVSNPEKYKHDEARKVAYEMCKIIATRAVGRLNMLIDRDKPVKPLWHRPDAMNAIIALAKRRMFLKMKEVYRKWGYVPCMSIGDSLVYCSDDIDPHTAVPGLMIREHELGGFKCEKTLAIDAQVISIFEDMDNADIAVSTLKKMEGVRR